MKVHTHRKASISTQRLEAQVDFRQKIGTGKKGTKDQERKEKDTNTVDNVPVGKPELHFLRFEIFFKRSCRLSRHAVTVITVLQPQQTSLYFFFFQNIPDKCYGKLVFLAEGRVYSHEI